MIVISDSEHEQYDKDNENYDDIQPVEAMNMLLISMQRLYQIDPHEMATLITSTYSFSSGELNNEAYEKLLTKTARSIQYSYDSRNGSSLLN